MMLLMAARRESSHLGDTQEGDTMCTDIPNSAAPARSPRGYCWVPTMDLEPGMVIARRVFAGPGGQVTINLAVGSDITASTIAQLINKGVECVAVQQRSEPDEATYADIVCEYESRLNAIFGPDPDENCRALLDALLADGPCQC